MKAGRQPLKSVISPGGELIELRQKLSRVTAKAVGEDVELFEVVEWM